MTTTTRTRISFTVTIGLRHEQIDAGTVLNRREGEREARRLAAHPDHRGRPVFVESDEYRGQGGGPEHVHRVACYIWNEVLGRSVERNPGGF